LAEKRAKVSKGLAEKARIRRAMELKMRGLSDKAISETMVEEKFHFVSERTINRILNDPENVNDASTLEVLEKQQLEDITRADVGLRLKWRADLIAKRRPPPKTEVEIKTTQPIRVVFDAGLATKEKKAEDADSKSA
jgi:hypothetical protein